MRRRGKDPQVVLDLLRECGYTRFESDGTALSDETIKASEEPVRMVCLAAGKKPA